MHRLQEVHMGIIFQDPSECNVSVVWEFYANWKLDNRSHFVTVRGVEVPLTPSAINKILGIVEAPSDASWLSLIISLCSHEPGSPGVVKNCYELLDTRAAFYRGDERPSLLSLCSDEGGPYKYRSGVEIDHEKGKSTSRSKASWSSRGKCGLHGTSIHHTPRSHKDKGAGEHAWTRPHYSKRNRRDEMIMLDEIQTKYPLNENVEVLLGLGPTFLEPVWDDVPTDEDKR
ncbi:hypothetical protein H5410_036989 [Solanum commersonii]|uniref:Putative plant transposon protein domain-containing protein n=1 Tax=Solanum commersonii TaxID=4109 RepID=A0A9J5Y6H5_SOLCO|nr:hypothetical protein H5410_036989 [Solanum commersonii]